jgi:hypothetical protein
MKQTNKNAIQKKIRDLFAYRRLTDLFRTCGLDEDHPFVLDLYTLQYQIYLLDAYLESTWELDKTKLEEHWEGIRSAFAPFPFSDKKIHALLKEIRDYERIETDCRQRRWPTEVSFKKFYTTKSCDVRLIRHLLYTVHPELSQFCDEKSWVYYDLITEINDDITDVYEDLKTFNANRYLISILRKGHLRTRESYADFISRVAHQAEVYFKRNHEIGENALLFEWTADRVLETMDLLHATTHTINHKLFAASYLLDKMK